MLSRGILPIAIIVAFSIIYRHDIGWKAAFCYIATGLALFYLIYKYNFELTLAIGLQAIVATFAGWTAPSGGGIQHVVCK